MTAQAATPNKSPHALVWIVGIAVILFCLAGIAAVFGWIPSSLGDPKDSNAISDSGKPQAKAAKAASSKPSSTPAPAVPPVQIAKATPTCAYCGVVASVQEVVTKGEGSGIGVAGGAVVGGLLGHQVGGGSGKQIATVVGAVGGAVAGNEVEKRMKSSKSYDVTVRLDDGTSTVIREADQTAWQTGDHVKIIDGALRRN
jgi:outer membrane lipoprotein SlyB